MESKIPKSLLRLDYWMISNNLSDLVTATDIIPTIRTDHDADQKLESWKMSLSWLLEDKCSLLADEE